MPLVNEHGQLKPDQTAPLLKYEDVF